MRSPDDLRVERAVASSGRTERFRVFVRKGIFAGKGDARLVGHTDKYVGYTIECYGAIDALDDGTFEARVWEYRPDTLQRSDLLYQTKHLAVFDTFDEAVQGITNAYLLGVTGRDLPFVDRPTKENET